MLSRKKSANGLPGAPPSAKCLRKGDHSDGASNAATKEDLIQIQEQMHEQKKVLSQIQKQNKDILRAVSRSKMQETVQSESPQSPPFNFDNTSLFN